MKKLTILSPIHAAMLLSVLFLVSCGDDDSPTAPGGGRLDSRLFGTWIGTGPEGEAVSLTFRKDGSVTFGSDELNWNVKWWIESGQLMLALVETIEYAISNGELTFTAVGNGTALLAVFAGAVFTADGDPGGLTGVNWVFEDIGFVFSSEGTVSLIGVDVDNDESLSNYPWANGTWTAEGRTITIMWGPSATDYEVRGETLTLLSPDGDRVVYSKQ